MLLIGRRPCAPARYRECCHGSASSEEPGMSVRLMFGNQEVSVPPTISRMGGRMVKAAKPKIMMHGAEKSDRPIVPLKRANKAGQPAAEFVEGRGRIKGNAQVCKAWSGLRAG